jgi:hypothetical protein
VVLSAFDAEQRRMWTTMPHPVRPGYGRKAPVDPRWTCVAAELLTDGLFR